jgi:hypothetical protein
LLQTQRATSPSRSPCSTPKSRTRIRQPNSRLFVWSRTAEAHVYLHHR